MSSLSVLLTGGHVQTSNWSVSCLLQGADASSVSFVSSQSDEMPLEDIKVRPCSHGLASIAVRLPRMMLHCRVGSGKGSGVDSSFQIVPEQPGASWGTPGRVAKPFAETDKFSLPDIHRLLCLTPCMALSVACQPGVRSGVTSLPVLTVSSASGLHARWISVRRAEINELISQLEAKNPTPNPTEVRHAASSTASCDYLPELSLSIGGDTLPSPLSVRPAAGRFWRT